MNPMDFFNQSQKNGFPFNAMPTPQFSPEKLKEFKKMIKQYHSILNDDFWGNIQGVGTKKEKNIEILPIEIWEDAENIYLSVVCPGLQEINHAKIFFHNDQVLTLKIKRHSIQPKDTVTLILSDLPQLSYEREIFLQKSVVTSDYCSSYEDSVLTYTFKKAKDELKIPFDF